MTERLNKISTMKRKDVKNMLDLKKYPYINVNITFYMRVNNSPMFGGKGSVGYTKLAIDECKNINDVPIEEMLSNLKRAESKLFEVCEDDIELIDKKIYDENTEDEIGDDEE